MEAMSESERFEHGCLSRELAEALVVAAIQGLFLMEEQDGNLQITKKS